MKSVVSTVQLEALSLLIAGRLGLHFPVARLRTMENALGQAARAAGFAQAGAFITALLRPAPADELFDALVRELTVGETYFFREPAVFTAITEHFLPEWSRRWTGRMALPRFWSVGCCTGEEAYSLAIALERHGFPAPERAEILASDLNPHFLRIAREGVYRAWSFRGAPDWLRPAYFRPVEGERVQLRGDIRRAVRFQRLNLAGDGYPSPENGTAAVDLILCRNVLMYFTPEQLGRAVRQLAACLVEGGWLVVGGAETGHVEAAELAPVRWGDLTIFVKNGAKTRAVVPHHAPARAEFPATPPPPPVSGSLGRDIPALPRRAEPPPSLDDARRSASSGDRAAALAICERVLRVDRMNAPAHFLRASSEVRVVRRWQRRRPTTEPFSPTSSPVRPLATGPASVREATLLVIGASTGGPVALHSLLARLPRDLPVPVLVVQHISPGFLTGMASWLQQVTGWPVRVARQAERPLPGHVYLAPDGLHMGVSGTGLIALSDALPKGGHRPAVSHLFQSVAETPIASRTVAVLLTGMGADGAAELKVLRDRGALTIAQDAESSVVHGMPGEAIRLGAAVHVLSPESIAFLLRDCGRRTAPAAKASV